MARSNFTTSQTCLERSLFVMHEKLSCVNKLHKLCSSTSDPVLSSLVPWILLMLTMSAMPLGEAVILYMFYKINQTQLSKQLLLS